jgi:hypothetical protein
VRAAQKPRIVESARWWKQGFQGAVFDAPIASLPQPDVSIIISDVRNTISHLTVSGLTVDIFFLVGEQ